MKIIYIYLFLFWLCAINPSFAQLHFSISGKIVNNTAMRDLFKDGDTISLEYTDFNIQKKAVVKNNSFSFDESVPEPCVAMLRYKFGGVKLMLDASSYDILLNMTEVSPNRFGYQGTVKTRSDNHNLWDKFYDDYADLNKNKRGLLDIKDQLHNEDSLRKVQQLINNVDSLILRSFKTLAIEHPNNFAVAYIMPDAPDFSYNNYIDIFNTLTESVKNSKRGKRTLAKLMAVKNIVPSQSNVTADKNVDYIGKKLPDVGAVDEKNKNISMSAEFAKSKYTLIEFWASWCAPCRTINIALRGKKESFKKAGVSVIGFSLDADIDNWKKAVKTDNTGWLQISDLKAQRSQLANYLSLFNIPSNIIVDNKGFIVAKDIYGDQLDKFLAKIEQQSSK